MTRYRVMLVRQMSQAIYVEADDVAGAVYEAIEQNTLTPNASNSFDESGDVEPEAVTDVATDRDVWTAQVSGDGSWED